MANRGLTDLEAAELLRIPPAMVTAARHGQAAIGMCLGRDARWHPISEGIAAYLRGDYDREAVDIAVARDDWERDAPNRKAIADAEANERKRQDDARAVNRAENERRAAIEARNDTAHRDALEAATGFRRA